ncbi:zinc finger CCCH domain-containing protein 45-like [Humulus lupulus]|uniref:zinc finger CCCH domain-containing protein 45-like n=1 Tax=Humulus lupulus TaxID=3486 RepID=UPI002B40FC79|nr:zinc finger CCCH domain-containing protein 45-like [Humulus lupulus]
MNMKRARTFDRMKKKRPRTLKRVSWAPDTDLCQVKLFTSDDCPAKTIMKSQEEVRGKSPPIEPTYVSQTQWKFPPMFVLSPSWGVVSGEESQEAKHQKWRETRVLEAVYPRLSSIPSSSSVCSEVENECYDDGQTPLIPLTPIEEEEEESPSLVTPLNPTTSSHEQPSLSQVPSDQPSSTKPSTDAYASLIDTNLLFKILSDPQMIEKFKNNGVTLPACTTRSAPVPETKQGYVDVNSVSPQQDSSSTISEQVVGLPSFSSKHLFTSSNQVKSATNIAACNQPNPMPPMKDLNYYKNLIRQHGCEKVEHKEPRYAQNGESYSYLEDPKLVKNYKPRDLTLKNLKPCTFYKTSKGCRNGANCPYQHDVPTQWRVNKDLETHNAKPMRLNTECKRELC